MLRYPKKGKKYEERLRLEEVIFSSSLILSFNIRRDLNGWMDGRMDGEMNKQLDNKQTDCSLNKENGIEIIILS